MEKPKTRLFARAPNGRRRIYESLMERSPGLTLRMSVMQDDVLGESEDQRERIGGSAGRDMGKFEGPHGKGAKSVGWIGKGAIRNQKKVKNSETVPSFCRVLLLLQVSGSRPDM